MPDSAARFVTRKWPPAVGGMETYCVKLAESLRQDGELQLIALPGQANGLPPTPLALVRFGLTTTLRLIFSRPYPVTRISDMASWPLGFAARLRSRKTKIIISAHGTDVSYPRRGGAVARLYALYLRLGAVLLKDASVIANSRATAEETRRYGYKNVTVVPLSTDMRQVARYKGARHVLFVGRLTPRKGCAWFIRNVLPLLDPAITLHVIGTVIDADERRALDDARVQFLGPKYDDDLAREYAEALCVVIPNIDVPTKEFEGFGLIAVEAFACGGVVVASNHSGLKEAVIAGKTGFLVEPGNAIAWSKTIHTLANQRIGEALRGDARLGLTQFAKGNR